MGKQSPEALHLVRRLVQPSGETRPRLEHASRRLQLSRSVQVHVVGGVSTQRCGKPCGAFRGRVGRTRVMDVESWTVELRGSLLHAENGIVITCTALKQPSCERLTLALRSLYWSLAILLRWGIALGRMVIGRPSGPRSTKRISVVLPGCLDRCTTW